MTGDGYDDDVKITCSDCGKLLTVTESEQHQRWRCGICAGTPTASPGREVL
jgi:ribosomal protein S27AE